MTKPITLRGFEATFVGNPDPWNTFDAPDERRKRRAIVHALGAGRHARMLELASGNGSNTAALAAHAVRLDATDGVPSAVRLTRRVAVALPRVTVAQLALPARFPKDRYDAIVAAEILYYLSAQDLSAVAREVARTLRPGGLLILAHSRTRFADAALIPAQVHDAFAAMLPVAAAGDMRTARWTVARYRRR